MAEKQVSLADLNLTQLQEVKRQLEEVSLITLCLLDQGGRGYFANILLAFDGSNRFTTFLS